MATYKQSYEQWLAARMEEGGSAAIMDACAAEYNAIVSDDYKPSGLFSTWLKDAEHSCTTCGRDFRLPDGKVEPDTETTCAECLSRSTTEADGAEERPAEDRQGPQ
jgi:DNA-directed RNA polymerase subunit RPC12/RpoP